MPWSRRANQMSWQNMPAGSVVQTVSRASTTSQSWASNAFPNANATDCYCYITPRFSNSLIFITVSACIFFENFGQTSDVGYGAGIYSSRTASLLEAHGHLGNAYAAAPPGGETLALVHVAAAGSTANQYFQLTLEPYSNNAGTRVYLNKNYQGTDTSTMVLMEVRQ